MSLLTEKQTNDLSEMCRRHESGVGKKESFVYSAYARARYLLSIGKIGELVDGAETYRQLAMDELIGLIEEVLNHGD